MMKMSIACSHGWTLCVSAPRSVRRGCFCGTNGCQQRSRQRNAHACAIRKAGTGNSAKAACDGTDEPSEPRRLSGPRCRQGSVAAARRAGLRVASSCPSRCSVRSSRLSVAAGGGLRLRSFPDLRPAVQNVLRARCSFSSANTGTLAAPLSCWNVRAERAERAALDRCQLIASLSPRQPTAVRRWRAPPPARARSGRQAGRQARTTQSCGSCRRDGREAATDTACHWQGPHWRCHFTGLAWTPRRPRLWR